MVQLITMVNSIWLKWLNERIHEMLVLIMSKIILILHAQVHNVLRKTRDPSLSLQSLL